jgi:hypothetical protein
MTYGESSTPDRKNLAFDFCLKEELSPTSAVSLPRRAAFCR